ncbi:hypothetical protein CMUST_15545 (plasmid) [Corynebacterium mustelae]|uniref:TrbL/VirB6 plasmid conjugal transfer protein n=1 Tax=Corynebacterium mustelae TaxID=571915 RepID=A0A0G3H6C0_9CORY|nr:hypothetical protein [Corynebacterium mustelae]AKK07398.1 hypothetical protein CMUST_15545 [Corynebacterium mustelae]
MAILRRLFVMLIVGLAISAIPPVVQAQTEDRNAYELAYDKCKKEHNFTKEDTLTRAIADALPDAIPDSMKSLLCADKAATENPGSAFSTLAEKTASEFWGDPVGKLASAMLEGNAQFMQLVMTFWMDFDTSSRVDVAANVQGVKNIVLGVSGFVLVGSFLVAGVRVVASRRRGLQDGVEELGENVGRWFVFSACVPVIVPGALVASDELSRAIMEQFGATSPDVFVDMTAFDDSVVGPVVMLVLTAVAIAGSVMQLLALVVRVLMLPIAAGLTPLFAAASFSETGRSGLTHLVGYMIAAVAFKPISALLYVVVLWNVTRRGEGSASFETAVINALMLALAGFVAPALVRMVVPMVSQAGGSSGAAALAAGGGAVGAGAKMLAPVAGGVAGAAAGAVPAAVSGAVGAVGGAARGVAVGAKIAPTASSAGGRVVQRVRNTAWGGVKGAGRGAVGGARRGGSAVFGLGARGGRGAMDAVASGAQGVGRAAEGLSGSLEGSLGYPGQIHR